MQIMKYQNCVQLNCLSQILNQIDILDSVTSLLSTSLTTSQVNIGRLNETVTNITVEVSLIVSEITTGKT